MKEINTLIMKTKIILLALFSFFKIYDVMACPVWIVGKLYVVDENNKPLTAQIWTYYASDSFLRSKDNYFSREQEMDTNVYNFWEGGLRYYSDNEVKSDKYLRIQAEGYADVIIKELKFDGEYNVPKIIIKMYPKRFVKTGQTITLLDHYVCNKELIVKDSMEINFADYLESIQNASLVTLGEEATLMTVECYPNPVTDFLVLKINAEVTEAYSTKLTDMQGKLIRQTALTSRETKYDLKWEVSGNYILFVYDPKGNPVFSTKLLKI